MQLQEKHWHRDPPPETVSSPAHSRLTRAIIERSTRVAWRGRGTPQRIGRREDGSGELLARADLDRLDRRADGVDPDPSATRPGGPDLLRPGGPGSGAPGRRRGGDRPTPRRRRPRDVVLLHGRPRDERRRALVPGATGGRDPGGRRAAGGRAGGGAGGVEPDRARAADAALRPGWRGVGGDGPRPGPWLAVPIVADDRLQGFGALGRKRNGTAYTERERVFLETLASHLAIAFERSAGRTARLGPYRILERRSGSPRSPAPRPGPERAADGRDLGAHRGLRRISPPARTGAPRTRGDSPSW